MFWKILFFITILLFFSACSDLNSPPEEKESINDNVIFTTSNQIDLRDYFPTEDIEIECSAANILIDDYDGTTEILGEKTVYARYEMIDNGFKLTTTMEGIDLSSYTNKNDNFYFSSDEILENENRYIFKNDRILINNLSTARNIDTNSYIFDYYYYFDDGFLFNDTEEFTKKCETGTIDETTHELSIICEIDSKETTDSYDYGSETYYNTSYAVLKMLPNQGVTYISSSNMEMNCSN